MATFFDIDFADGGPDMLRARAATAGRLRLRALGSYSAGDSFATVSGATLGYAALSASDITSSGAVGATRQHTLAGKTITLSAGDDGAGLHYAITDETASKVLFVGPGAADVTPLDSGGTLTSPSFVFASNPQ
jgi:hypothetical protein